MTLEERIRLLADNTELCSTPAMPYYSRVISALTFAVKEEKLNADRIQDAKKAICSATGLFSPLRAEGGTLLAAQMAVEGRRALLSETQLCIDALRKAGFSGSSAFLPIAACSLRESGLPAEETAQKVRMLYRELLHAHPFITSEADISGCVLMVAAGRDFVVQEEMYQALLTVRDFGESRDELQSASMLLSLAGEGRISEAVARYVAVRKTAEMILGSLHGRGAAALACTALLSRNPSADTQQLCAAAKLLEEQKEFSRWRTDKSLRLTLCTALYSDAWTADGVIPDTVAAAQLLRLLVSQQTALLCACCTAAATTASHS